MVHKGEPLPAKFGDLPTERGEFHLQHRNLREATPPHKHTIDRLEFSPEGGSRGSAARHAGQNMVYYQPGNGNGVAEAMRHAVMVDAVAPPPAQSTYAATLLSPRRPSEASPIERHREFRSVGSSLAFPAYQGPAYHKDLTHRAHDVNLRSPRSIHQALSLVGASTSALQSKISTIVHDSQPGLLYTPRPAAGTSSSGSMSARGAYGPARGGAITVVAGAQQALLGGAAAAALTWDSSPVRATSSAYGGSQTHRQRGGDTSYLSPSNAVRGDGGMATSRAAGSSLAHQSNVSASGSSGGVQGFRSSEDILRDFKLRRKVALELRKASDSGIAFSESREQALYNPSVYR